MILMGTKIILTNIDLVGTTILVVVKNIWTDIDLFGATILADANNSDRRKEDLDKH